MTWFALHYPGIKSLAELRHYTEHLADELNSYDQSRIRLWESEEMSKRFPPPEMIRPYCQQRVPIDPRAFSHSTGRDV